MTLPRRTLAATGALALIAGLAVGSSPAIAATPQPGTISLRGTSSASDEDGGTLSIPRPTGVAAGDVLLARVANRGDVAATYTAAGWTKVTSNNSARWLKSVLYVRTAGADEPSSYAFDVSGESPLVGTISAYRGVDAADPIEDVAGKVTGASTVFNTPSVDASTGNAVAVWFGLQLSTGIDCATAGLTAPPSFTENVDDCLASTSGLSYSVASRQLGAPGTWSVKATESLLPLTNLTQIVTLRPAAALSVATRYASSSVDVGTLWEDADGVRDTAIADSQLHEPSGIAVSRANPGIAYVHSESDVQGMVAIKLSNAEVVGRYAVTIPDQWDWEDIAVGPCPSGSCIFAGDIGRANGKADPPSTFAVYRTAEPDIDAGKVSGTIKGEWFRFRYPDGPHNAEALMVHPVTGAVYVITKEPSGASGVYTFPDALPAAGSDTTVTTLTKVTTLQLPEWSGDPADTKAATWYPQVTAAAVHPAGDRFLVRTPYAVWEYRAPSGGTFADAFDATPVALTAPTGEGQGEAIDYAADGSAYYTVGEKAKPPFVLKRVDRR